MKTNWFIKFLIFFLITILIVISIFFVKKYQILNRDRYKKEELNYLVDSLNTYWENYKSYPDEIYVNNLIKEKGFSKDLLYLSAKGCDLVSIFTKLENTKDKNCISSKVCNNLGYRFVNGCCFMVTISKQKTVDTNEVETTNITRDAVVRNDAAEILNAYERYYATVLVYPWMNSSVDQKKSILLRSDAVGFGVCAADIDTKNYSKSPKCNNESNNFGVLISTNELRKSFTDKDSFQSVIDGHPENALWLSYVGGEWSPRVCYIPRAKVNRKSNSMFCLNDNGQAKRTGTVGCETPATTDPIWCQPEMAINSNKAIFKCVPEQ